MGYGIVPKSKSGTLEINVGGHKGRTTRGANIRSFADQGGKKAVAAGAVKKIASKSDWEDQLPWRQKKLEEMQTEQETALVVEDTLSEEEEDDRALFLNPRTVFKKHFSWTIWKKNMHLCISAYLPSKAFALPSQFLK